MNQPPPTYDPRRWQRDHWDEPGTIYFWSGQGSPHESFSNFAATPFTMAAWHAELGDVEFATGEHAFQAAKGPTALEHERIRLAHTPMGAKQLGRRVALPADWSVRRSHVMLAVVRAKFARGTPRELLLSTADALLAEDSPYDPVWGCRDRAGGYTGANLLGRALMRVRDELRAPPAPYDGHPFAPIGTLTEPEHAWGRRLVERGWRELGWHVVGRDQAGDLVAVTILPCEPSLPSHQRHCYQTFTQAGLVYRTATVPIGDPATSAAT